MNLFEMIWREMNVIYPELGSWGNIQQEAQQGCDRFRWQWVRNGSKQKNWILQENIGTFGFEKDRSWRSKYNIRQKFLFSKLISTSTEKGIERSFPEKIIHYKTLSQKLSDFGGTSLVKVCQNYILRNQKNILAKKTLKNSIIYFCRTLSFGPLTITFQQVCQNCILSAQRNILRKKLKKIIQSKTLWTRNAKLRDF